VKQETSQPAGQAPTGSATLVSYRFLLFWAGLCWVGLLWTQLPLFFTHISVNYGDSYILDGAQHFHDTGELYPLADPQERLPALYSPLLYWLIAETQAWFPGNPYIGPRILELLWFLAAVASVGLLTRRLIPMRRAWWWGAFLAAAFSTKALAWWVLQLRAEFPGIALSLLALYALTSPGTKGPLWAGIAAGLALQFKVTFVAAPAAGCLWLALGRRWRDLAVFATGFGVCSAGVYLWIAPFEPGMFPSLLLLGKMIPHVAGTLHFLGRVAREPMFVLAAITLLLGFRRFALEWRRWQLLILYLGVTAALATYTSVQFGGNINYFYELLMGATPLAVIGLFRLKLGHHFRHVVLLAGISVLTLYVAPVEMFWLWWGRNAVEWVRAGNEAAKRLEQELRGLRVFSSVPDVSLVAPGRVVMEPLLLNYMVMVRGASIEGLESRLRERDFDVVFTGTSDFYWRGVPVLHQALLRQIEERYRPYCLLERPVVTLAHLPSEPGPNTEEVKRRLARLGCEPQVCEPGTKCPGLSVRVEQMQ
jgi:hypothetical protein